MKMRSKERKFAVPALVLCISVFLMQTAVYAKELTDTTAPVVKAELYGNTLHIEATDDNGVDAVFINNKRVNYRVNNALDVSLSDYVAEGESVSIYAIDFSGNRSKVSQVRNAASKTSGNSSYSASTSEISGNSDISENPKAFTPDGQASVTDTATDEDGKEFYTFTTSDDHVFYLVIDKERETDNVYFLNVVTEQDLLSLAEDEKGSTGVKNSEEVCTCINKCELGAVDSLCPVCRNDVKTCLGTEKEGDKETKDTKDKGGGIGMIFFALAAAAACGAGYYLKVYKPKHDLDDAEDIEDLFEDDEYISEEEESEISETEGTAYTQTQSELYDDYPDYEVRGEEKEYD